MPFYFDMTKIEWPEDDNFVPGDPKLADFQYLPAPEFSGNPEPARFVLQRLDDVRSADPKPTGSLIGRMFGRQPQPNWLQKQEQRAQIALAIVVPALRAMGVQTVYCRYDGGNDEGFAWLDHFQMSDGIKLAADALFARLASSGVVGKLTDAHFEFYGDGASETEKVRQVVDGWLASAWVSKLLISGFGTGEYYLYGACTVDLETGLITDDPKAAPIVQNIVIVDAPKPKWGPDQSGKG